MNTVYHSGGAFFFNSGTTTTVSNTQYDNLTNLTNLTAGYYTKHSLFLNNNANTTANQFILLYGQAQYSGLSLVQAAGSPNPPSYIDDNIVHLADIIVQQGSGSIVSISDERPRPSFAASAAAAIITVHGDLSGLSADDHTQYLLVNGSRNMAASINMGGNSITNVNLVDGVDVSAHGTRHDPFGADPAAAGLPTDITPAVASTGIQNSWAISDHVHGYTAPSGVNLGTGTNVFKDLSSSNLQFKTLVGTGINITSDASQIYINTADPNGYLFAYSTGTQTVASAGVFQDITFSHSPIKTGWTHTSGSASFTCQQEGVYEASYTATTSRTAGVSTAISIIATLGGTEIAGSQTMTTHAANNVPAETSNQIIFIAASGDIFKTQLNGTTTTSRIVGAGSGTTTPSMRLAIHKL
jgi:hypothetical protein